ncbi:hypothetical protein NJE56_09580 [Bacillus pumilus]|uniref:hypothetical protein n=1 Tax=Bacillus pumilus TaxID=1408 RepID=UPI0029C5586D|nr:hypothetical protein [Bacillus pumilus]MDX5485205.1 hypothetical protein [Bacillus pumilus]
MTKIKEEIKKDVKNAFIVMPIGPRDSDIRRSSEGIYQAVIKPTLEELGYKPSAAHEIDDTGSINKQIIERLLNDELVIANLTGLNPNVMYELAVRHATGKAIVSVCQEGTTLPFDLYDERTIFYEDDMKGVIELKQPFKRMVIKCLENTKIDNPIYRVATDNLIEENIKKSSPQDLGIYTKLNELENMIRNISIPTGEFKPRNDPRNRGAYKIIANVKHGDFEKFANGVSSFADECGVSSLQINQVNENLCSVFLDKVSISQVKKISGEIKNMGYENEAELYF